MRISLMETIIKIIFQFPWKEKSRLEVYQIQSLEKQKEDKQNKLKSKSKILQPLLIMTELQFLCPPSQSKNLIKINMTMT